VVPARFQAPSAMRILNSRRRLLDRLWLKDRAKVCGKIPQGAARADRKSFRSAQWRIFLLLNILEDDPLEGGGSGSWEAQESSW